MSNRITKNDSQIGYVRAYVNDRSPVLLLVRRERRLRTSYVTHHCVRDLHSRPVH